MEQKNSLQQERYRQCLPQGQTQLIDIDLDFNLSIYFIESIQYFSFIELLSPKLYAIYKPIY